jgi:C-terminal processing protease CtpA/Prc
MRAFFGSFLLFVLCGTLSAQMTPAQRVEDFNVLTDIYAKRYAPWGWKAQALGFDLFQTSSWLDRVRRAKDDLEYYEIAAQYVASLQDTHTQFQVPSAFSADTGIAVDIYDGKVLIESINRLALPQSQYPFQIGDEIISVDGKTSEEWITYLSQFRRWGSPLTTRRDAADRITFRPQSLVPRAVELGDTASIVIRNGDTGDAATYAVPWMKRGFPLFQVGPVPSPPYSVLPNSTRAAEQADQEPDYLAPLNALRNWSLPSNYPLFQGTTTSEDGTESLPRRYVLGVGSRSPVFVRGLPAGFVPRLGTNPADFHFSGTWTAGGRKIGYLRIPNFSPPSAALAIRELDTEISYFQANTDALVIDVMRNPGGGCYMANVAAHLISQNFYFFGQEFRPELDVINSLEAALQQATLAQADQWIIDTYNHYLQDITRAYSENRGMTGSIAACSQLLTTFPPNTVQLPASTVYTKPLIILVDEFSISAADIFPAMMQDNNRGVVVGMRTSGGGGSISGWPAGYYSEAIATNTNSLVVRNHPIVTAEYPAAPLVENIGVRPDITLDYMTRDNLLNHGATFVTQFTSILLDQINSSQQ